MYRSVRFLLIALLLLLPWSAARAAVAELDATAVADPALRQALQASFNRIGIEAAPLDGQQEALRTEQARLAQMVRAFGYLDATVRLAFAAAGPAVLTPQLGRKYRIGAIVIEGLAADGAAHAAAQRLLAPLQAATALPAGFEQLHGIELEILRHLQDGAFARARIARLDVAPDGVLDLASVRVVVETGAAMTFGALRLHGLHRLSSREVTMAAPFSAGDPYSMSDLVALGDMLRAQPDVRNVRISEIAAAGGGNVLDIDVYVDERPWPLTALLRLGLPGVISLSLALLLIGWRQVSLASGRTHVPFGALDLVILATLVIAAVCTFIFLLHLQEVH